MDDSRSASTAPEEAGDAIEYDPETDTYRATYDGSTESASTAVVSTVAAVAEVGPLEIEPLYATVDPDALDALMDPVVSGPSRGDIRVTFSLAGHDVTVHSYGIVAVRPPDEETAP